VKNKDISVNLLTVTEKQETSLLHPYPDWSWYKDDCKTVIGCGRNQVDVSILSKSRIIHSIV